MSSAGPVPTVRASGPRTQSGTSPAITVAQDCSHVTPRDGDSWKRQRGMNDDSSCCVRSPIRSMVMSAGG
jgi:hypothetical protein